MSKGLQNRSGLKKESNYGLSAGVGDIQVIVINKDLSTDRIRFTLALLKSMSTPVQKNLTFANYPTNNIYGDVSMRRTL